MQAGFVELSRINSSSVPERTKAHGVLAKEALACKRSARTHEFVKSEGA